MLFDCTDERVVELRETMGEAVEKKVSRLVNQGK